MILFYQVSDSLKSKFNNLKIPFLYFFGSQNGMKQNYVDDILYLWDDYIDDMSNSFAEFNYSFKSYKIDQDFIDLLEILQKLIAHF